MVSGEHPVPTSTIPASLPIENERYQIVELLGRGGMGEVHKAWDPRLGRHVALKIMRSATPEQAARLVFEARAQARVEHANVCKVYGVGELNGMPFIALQFIAGETLRERAPRMTREQRIAVMRDCADALHAAHRQGLVHRDVKPTNILIEATEAGYKPFVTDFGIAREIDTPGLTKTGMAQGTPLYMAPEQARGETHRIDRRTDVYGLGVTLYELLSGRRPFEGETSLGVILKVLHEEPPPLRSVDPSIPLDLETITMKCLEKDPARRYDTARALALDLQSWLDGEPIQARRARLGYRLARRARKHLALLSTATVLVVGGASMAGYALHARRAAAEQARLAHAFGQDVERNDAIARYAALLPLHDTRRERAIIEKRMAALERRTSELGALAEGPGRYALGRGYLVLERPDDARRELERAWQAGYRTPEVSYALGLAFGQQFQRALADTPHTADKELDAARRAELERRFRDPALAHLKNAVGLAIEAPEYVEGLIALHERRYPIALDKARAAQAQVPWMYEAHTLEGDIHLTIAKEQWAKGEPDDALTEVDRAGLAYRTASQMAHSSASALAGDCRRFLLQAEILGDRDRSPAEAVKGALAACGAALQASPDDTALYADEVDGYLELARFDSGHNGDPRPAWSEAARIADEALHIDATDVRALLAVGTVEKSRANYELEHGEDPRPRLERAITYAREAERRDPRSFDALGLECDAWTERGDWEGSHGVDPRAAYDTAAETGLKALALSARGFKGYNSVGLAYLSRGMWELNDGLDPQPALALATRTYDKVVEVSPKVDYGYSNLCATWQTLGEYQIKRGVDPTAALARAVSTCEKAIVIDPNYAGTYLNLGCAHFDVAVWQRDQNVDPSVELELARGQMRRSLEVDHAYEFAFRYLGEVELLAARWATDHAGAPAAGFELARSSFERALAINDKNAETLRELAELHRWRAAFKATHHQSIDADVRAGLQRAAEALKVNPRLGAAALQAGALHLTVARAATGPARRDAITRAKEALARALGLNLNLERETRPLLDEARRLAP